jgi:MoxR-like ATPase
MSNTTMFEPKAARLLPGDEATSGRDLRDGSVYVWTYPTVLAVRVAQATGRPLLIGGPPGSGKSSLAAFVARSMNWNYFEKVITSRTQAQDLQWTFDAVRRLRDAYAARNEQGDTNSARSEKIEAYIEPGVLWWAFDPAGALRRGFRGELPPGIREADPPGELRDPNQPSVVLLDEIDKADPDVPNDLLVALGSQCFRVAETGAPVEARWPPLMFITTNNERALPAAFLRRCVVHTLELPDSDRLVEIARAHFPRYADQPEQDLLKQIADKVVEMRRSSDGAEAVTPSTAEYLDAVRACLHFNVRPDDSDLVWKAITQCVLKKQDRT